MIVISSPRTNKREEAVMSPLPIGRSYMTGFSLLKGKEPPACISCDDLLTIAHTLLSFVRSLLLFVCFALFLFLLGFLLDWIMRAESGHSDIEGVVQRCAFGLHVGFSEIGKRNRRARTHTHARTHARTHTHTHTHTLVLLHFRYDSLASVGTVLIVTRTYV